MIKDAVQEFSQLHYRLKGPASAGRFGWCFHGVSMVFGEERERGRDGERDYERRNLNHIEMVQHKCVANVLLMCC